MRWIPAVISNSLIKLRASVSLCKLDEKILPDSNRDQNQDRVGF